MLGFFSLVGLLCYNFLFFIYFYFYFFRFYFKIFFWVFFFFCLKVEQIIFILFYLRVFLILVEGVPNFF